MGILLITGRAWRDLPLVIILGLLIGGLFGELVKRIPPQDAPVTTRVKR